MRLSWHLFAAFVLSIPAPRAAAAEPQASPGFVEVIEVTARPPGPPASAVLEPDDASLRPASDGGDLLRLMPGVTAGRIGGHGLEPVIRGQSQTQLNVILDGAFIHGGCPNRMDPPSSYAEFDTADRITVLRGFQSVQYGPGGSGGTILFEHLPPVFEPGRNSQATAGAGYSSNGDMYGASADVAAHYGSAYARAIGRGRDSDNYQDGDGREVRSAFTQYGGGLFLGWTRTLDAPHPQQFAEVSVEFDTVEDALFPGVGMDAPDSDDLTIRGRLGWAFEDVGALRALRATAYAALVDHLMDNFSLRPRNSMFRLADSDSDTFGGNVALDLAWSRLALTLGIDVQNNDRNATRFGNNTDRDDVTLVQSILWPDVSLTQSGAFAEVATPFTEAGELTVGLRYNYVCFSYGAADRRAQLPTMGVASTPNELYSRTYGVTAGDVTEHNVDGLIRLTYDIARGTSLFTGFSRAVRTADATERSLASDMGPESWIGNPVIDPEKHHQFDVGVSSAGGDWSLEAVGYVNKVEDFILRDSARGQPDILITEPETDVYRNIDAILAGVEIEGQLRLGDYWYLLTDAFYTYGENQEIDEPLPQIPPLQGMLTLMYQAKHWLAGMRLSAAAKQGRVDLDPTVGSGRDVRETPGYATVDLFGGVDIGRHGELHFGVTNLVDESYANHLNRSSVFDNVEVQVNEPGRSFYVAGRLTW